MITNKSDPFPKVSTARNERRWKRTPLSQIVQSSLDSKMTQNGKSHVHMHILHANTNVQLGKLPNFDHVSSSIRFHFWLALGSDSIKNECAPSFAA